MFVLVATGGALYVGTKAYRKHLRKKGLAHFLRPQNMSGNNLDITPLALYDKAKVAIQRLRSGGLTAAAAEPLRDRSGAAADTVGSAAQAFKLGGETPSLNGHSLPALQEGAGKRRFKASRSVASRNMSLKGFVRYAVGYWRRHWRMVLVIVPSLLVFKLYSTSFALSLKTIVDTMLAAGGGGTIILILVILVIGFPIAAGGYLLGQRLTAKASADILNDMRFRMFEHLQRLSIGFYKRNETGNILSRFSSDIDQIEKGITRKSIDALIAVLALSLNIPLLFFLDWRLAALTVVALPTMSAILGRLVPKATSAGYRLQEEKAKTINIVQENVSTQLVVKGYEYQGPMTDVFQGQLDELRGKSVDAIFLKSLVESLSVLSLLFSQLLVTCLGGLFVLHASLSPGSLVAFLSLLMVTHRDLYDIAKRIVPNMISAIGGVQRIEDLLHEIPQITDAADAVNIPRIGQELRFEQVTFSYTGEQNQLDDISFTVPAGHYVAIVGPSGAGKSTILNLIMRFYDTTEGRVTIDGHDVRQVTQESLRAQMGMVFQEAFLFNTTIRDNIRVSKLDATDEEVETAAKAAEIHDFVMTLPQEYDTVVGERGGRLSAGQQQRISIARAVLRDPAILLLDEATSALDLETEAAIMSTIELLTKGRTVICVTHRLQSITNADRIFVLDVGHLIECGRHEELLEQQGVYHQLWHKQDRVEVT